ncbi:hypothetical protein KY290_033538 [Solanum tuberosum]|nr:hypothetical protein KY289_032898 [Solanum tuberosum]KAH0644605.1 hypothetical protein KY284_032489 [Solanum tuberosum]KAH0647545.1 hypothetical protein KY285_032793 [Solanum tuberosum]KAH0740495.1 hypothetical protein KY290_033538 [Solanum tuberosum]
MNTRNKDWEKNSRGLFVLAFQATPELILLRFMLYSNLEDKVLFEVGSIVVNTDGPKVGQAVGPRAKLQRDPRIRQANTGFALDPG